MFPQPLPQLASTPGPAPGTWLSSAAADGSTWCYAGLLLVGCVVLASLLRALVIVPRVTPESATTPRRLLARLHDEAGTATVEFTLVFAPALWVCLILLQTVLVFAGQVFVHYAAFAATRSAIVHIPSGLLGGGGQLAYGDNAFNAAQRAAAFALAPVSGQLSDTAGTPAAYVAGLKDMFADLEQGQPNWVDRLAGQRLAYALQHTDVLLYNTRFEDGGTVGLVRVPREDGEANVYGPKDPVTLGVVHDLHLSIPYASAFFADGDHDTAGGETAYATVRATCTLTLEGSDRNLPPRPTDEDGNILEREP
jgi:hypothetical protein